MSTVKSLYGSSNQTITCTITSLANNAQEGSAAIDNTSNLYIEVLVQVEVKTNASGTSATGVVNIYAYGTANGGTDYGDRVTGTNASQTLTSPPNLRPIGVINCVANATTYVSDPFPVSVRYGGFMPDHWGIVVENKTGAALDPSVGGAWFQGMYQQVS